jgi:hypothetical protein
VKEITLKVTTVAYYTMPYVKVFVRLPSIQLYAQFTVVTYDCCKICYLGGSFEAYPKLTTIAYYDTELFKTVKVPIALTPPVIVENILGS